MKDATRTVQFPPSGFVVTILAIGFLSLVTTIALSDWHSLSNFYWLALRSNSLEAELGFHAEWQRFDQWGLSAFVITEVEQDGVLARAGFRVGDCLRPAFHHGDGPAMLYSGLQQSRTRRVEFELINTDEFLHWPAKGRITTVGPAQWKTRTPGA